MEKFILNPGPLTSFNSLSYYLAPQLSELRYIYRSGGSPKIELDLRNLSVGFISIPALASLLSVTRRISEYVNYPIETYFSLNPVIQSFLNSVDFFSLALKLNILTWDNSTVGGFFKSSINPNTRILYFGDVIYDIESYSSEDLILLKALHKEKIGPNLKFRISEIFKNFDSKLQNIIENTTLELIMNCLIHGKDYAFVGIQRTSKRITISVCDSGIGFQKSLKNSYKKYYKDVDLNNAQSIVIASMIQEDGHGLKGAISQVLNYNGFNFNFDNHGWVIISSFDTEIRWQKKNWDKALSFYDKYSIRNHPPDLTYILGSPTKTLLSKERLEKGYWKKFDHLLVGSRVTFEIVL